MELYKLNYTYHGTAFKDVETVIDEEAKYRAKVDVRTRPFKEGVSLPGNNRSLGPPQRGLSTRQDHPYVRATPEGNTVLGGYDPKVHDTTRSRGDLGACQPRDAPDRPNNRLMGGRPVTAGAHVPTHYDFETVPPLTVPPQCSSPSSSYSPSLLSLSPYAG
jgi:hypothetical protein